MMKIIIDGKVATVPSGGVENTNNVYSEEEVVVGTYFDKPHYRRVISVTSGNSNTITTLFDASELNVDTLVYLGGVGIAVGYECNIPMVFPEGTLAISYQRSNNTIVETHTTDLFNSIPMTIVFEYTKSTD